MRKFLINVGFARCGTTALHRYFADQKLVSVPRKEKEIDAFLSEISIEDYLEYFPASESGVYFESSPTYTHDGLRAFDSVLRNITKALLEGSPADNDVILIFSMRNPLERAFSQYWHEIEKHHCIFGRLWHVSHLDNPERLSSPYELTFFDALKKNGKSLLPQFGKMIALAVKRFGPDRVLIMPNAALEKGLRDFAKRAPFLQGISDFTMPVSSSAQAPYYLYAGRWPSHHFIETKKGFKSIEVPKNSALLVSNRHVEMLRGNRFDVPKIVSASSNWSRSVEPGAAHARIEDYVDEQLVLLSKVPEECFVGMEKEAVLEDLASVPPNLEIKSAVPALEVINAALKWRLFRRLRKQMFSASKHANVSISSPNTKKMVFRVARSRKNL